MKRFFYYTNFILLMMVSSCVKSNDLTNYCANFDNGSTSGNKVEIFSGNILIPSNFELVADNSSINTVYNSNLKGQVGSITLMPVEKCPLCKNHLDSSNLVVSFYQQLYEMTYINLGEITVIRMTIKKQNEAMINVVVFAYDDKNALHINSSDENLWCNLISSWKN